MKHFERFAKITKIDEDERMVYGWASTPDLDSDGEIIKLSAIEKALPEYMKFPTLREMHQAKAAGKTIEATIKNGEQKGLYVGAKVVADDTWKLVKEGVYTAFSIGGNVIKRVGNVIESLELVEISLVDVPANKKAVVELWKAGKISKDAETAYSMANLMIQVKEMMNYCEYLGKPTKKLAKILELIKQLVVEEASGEEVQMSANVLNTKDKIAVLEKMDLSDNVLADALRLGVIALMKDKKLKKVEDVKEEEQVTPAEAETTETEEVIEEEVEETTEEVTEEKETSEDVEMTKISTITDKLTKILGTKVEPEVAEKMNLSKKISGLVESFEKVAGVLEAIDERLKKVESTPAEIKSKTVAVHKTNAEVAEIKESSELDLINKRLEELDGEHSKLGASNFSKIYSSEVSILLSQKDKITGNS